MSSILRIKLATGETHEVPFHSTSTIRVTTPIQGGAELASAFADVADLKLVAAPDVAAPVTGEQQAALTSPAVAIVHAKGLPLADAAAHIEKALAKFPDDDDLAQVWQDLGDAVRAGQDTWSTSVEPDVEAPGEPGEDAWLDNPETAASHINAQETVDDALDLLDVALAKWPTHDGLLELKQRADELSVDATAAAAELADQHGIDLATIAGSGAGGRITKGDVEAAVEAAK